MQKERAFPLNLCSVSLDSSDSSFSEMPGCLSINTDLLNTNSVLSSHYFSLEQPHGANIKISLFYAFCINAYLIVTIMPPLASLLLLPI